MNDAKETVIGGTGQVYVVDALGATLPEEATAEVDGGFSGLGYHTEDGASVNRSQEILRVAAWQADGDIRRKRQSEAFRITFALQQWNDVNVPLAFGGGEISETDDGFRYDPPAIGDDLDEKALICDVEDGDDVLRFVIPTGTVVEAVDTQFAATSTSLLPITFEALTPEDGSRSWYLLSNLAGFTEGSP